MTQKPFRGVLTWDNDTKKFVEVPSKKKFSEVNAPLVINDEIEPIRSYATREGKVFTSKRAYFKHLREHGFRSTEGENIFVTEKPKTEREILEEEEYDAETVKQAYMDVKYDRVPFTEQEKENHKREKELCERNGVKWQLKNPY